LHHWKQLPNLFITTLPTAATSKKKAACNIAHCVPIGTNYGVIKGLSQPGKRAEFAYNIHALPFKEDLSIDDSFIAIQLAEQHLL
jgi:hypothetical protein